MRPYLSSHASLVVALRYPRQAQVGAQRQAVPIAATVPFLPEQAALKLYEMLRSTAEGPAEILTVTLSLPRGRQLTRAGWTAAISVMWRAFGLHGNAMVWEAWRHDDTDTSHIHILVVLVRLDGHRLELRGRERACDRADIALSRHLGVQHFPYPWASPGRLVPPVPQRRLRARSEGRLDELAAGLGQVMRVTEPGDRTALVAAVERARPGGYTLAYAPNRHGTLALEFRQPLQRAADTAKDTVVPGGRLSPWLTPLLLDRCLAHAALLRPARQALEIGRLLKMTPFLTSQTVALRRMLDDQIQPALARFAALGPCAGDPRPPRSASGWTSGADTTARSTERPGWGAYATACSVTENLDRDGRGAGGGGPRIAKAADRERCQTDGVGGSERAAPSGADGDAPEPAVAIRRAGVSGYAARSRLLRQVLQDGSGPAAQVGAVGQGGAAALFADGTRLAILADQVEIRFSSADTAPPAVIAFASRLADIAALPLMFCDADMALPDPSPSPS